MANRRMVHRKIVLCEELADCSTLARLVYTWGIVFTSDWGVLEVGGRKLKAQLFPISDETAEAVNAAAEELVQAGLWVPFSENGNSYVYYPNFDRYQRIDQRAAASRDGIPRPPEARADTQQCSTSRRESPRVAEESRESVRKEVKEVKEVKREEAKEAKASPEQPGDPFSDGQGIGKQHRLDDPSQAAANACLAVWGLTHEQVENYPRYIKAIKALIKQRTGGAEEVRAWAEAEPRQVLGDGAKPEEAIPAEVRRGVETAAWQKRWATVRRDEKPKVRPVMQRGPSGPEAFQAEMSDDQWAAMSPEAREAYLEKLMSGSG